MNGRTVPREELTRYHDHRGMFHQSCPHCGFMIILFDDDEHWCDAETEPVGWAIMYRDAS